MACLAGQENRTDAARKNTHFWFLRQNRKTLHDQTTKMTKKFHVKQFAKKLDNMLRICEYITMKLQNTRVNTTEKAMTHRS